MKYLIQHCLCVMTVVGLSIYGHVYASVDRDIAIHLSLLYDTYSDYTAETMYDFDDAQGLLDTDLVTLITNTADPEQSLHLYMSDLQYTIRQQSTNQHLLIERRNDELARERHCLSQKQVSDDDFFQSVQQGLSDDMLVAIADDSAAMGACAEQARVKARAYQVMIQKIDTYRQQLQERFTLLRNNESFILQHYSLATTDPAIMSQMNRLIHALDE